MKPEGKGRGKQAWAATKSSNRLRLPGFLDNGKVIDPTHLPPLPPRRHTGRLYTPHSGEEP